MDIVRPNSEDVNINFYQTSLLGMAMYYNLFADDNVIIKNLDITLNNSTSYIN